MEEAEKTRRTGTLLKAGNLISGQVIANTDFLNFLQKH
jgi:hypothetical protein